MNNQTAIFALVIFALRCLSSKITLMLALCLATSSLVAAQAQRQSASTPKRAFSVPCTRALKIGLDEVETLYDNDQKRRFKDQTDSGTEGAANQQALRHYISCRRNDNLARSKKLEPSARTDLSAQAAAAKRLAQTRFELIYAISFDEHAEDPLNYAMTHRALALIEDYRGELITAFSNNDREFVSEQRAAERNTKNIEELLARLESHAPGADDAEDFRRKLASLRQAITKIQNMNADAAPSEKVATTRFILALIKLGLPD
jgi:hypothetical protein